MNTDTLARLAQRLADQLAALHTRYEEGQLTRSEFVTTATAFLDGAAARATALADVALAAEVSRLRRQVAIPLGLAPTPVQESVVTEALDSPQYEQDGPGAVEVLARAVTLAAAQDATQNGMRQHEIKYWTRDPNAGACEVCEDLADGLVTVDQVMWTHKGCGCARRPVA